MKILTISLSASQERKVKDLVAYYGNSVYHYCRNNGNRKFTDQDSIFEWFDSLNEWDNFCDEHVMTFILENQIKDVHDLLYYCVKSIGLKRKNTVTPERRAKLHQQIIKLKEKYDKEPRHTNKMWNM